MTGTEKRQGEGAVAVGSSCCCWAEAGRGGVWVVGADAEAARGVLVPALHKREMIGENLSQT